MGAPSLLYMDIYFARASVAIILFTYFYCQAQMFYALAPARVQRESLCVWVFSGVKIRMHGRLDLRFARQMFVIYSFRAEIAST